MADDTQKEQASFWGRTVLRLLSTAPAVYHLRRITADFTLLFTLCFHSPFVFLVKSNRTLVLIAVNQF